MQLMYSNKTRTSVDVVSRRQERPIFPLQNPALKYCKNPLLYRDNGHFSRAKSGRLPRGSVEAVKCRQASGVKNGRFADVLYEWPLNAHCLH